MLIGIFIKSFLFAQAYVLSFVNLYLISKYSRQIIIFQLKANREKRNTQGAKSRICLSDKSGFFQYRALFERGEAQGVGHAGGDEVVVGGIELGTGGNKAVRCTAVAEKSAGVQRPKGVAPGETCRSTLLSTI